MKTLPTLLVFLSFAGLVLGSPLIENTSRRASLQEPPVDDIAFEEAQTAKLLGVPVQKFPAPQGLTGIDEIPPTAPPFRFTLKPQPPSGPPPRVDFEPRKIVKAVAPDGSIYEAYCGTDNDQPREVVPDKRFVSIVENRRQWYENHLGYWFNPANVYIGKRKGGLIRATLFFRDVGSQRTAPHTLAIDGHGLAHLAVADVNFSQNNRLDMYWATGDPRTGKWTAAWLIDRRGFTSSSQPWSGAWNDKVHLIWDWCDVSYNKGAPGMGAYHVEWSPNGFSRKVRFFNAPVREVDGAIDPRTGLLVIVLVKDSGGVYVLSRTADGKWTQPALLDKGLTGYLDASIEATKDGTFVIRTDADVMRENPRSLKEWLLRPTM